MTCLFLSRMRSSVARASGAVLLAWASLCGPVQSAAPVSGPIRILVGFPAGGTIDVVTRQIADQMQASLGVPMVVEALPGAGGQLAAQALRRAQPDGRTLMVAPDHTAVIVPLTLKSPGYDVLKDFAPVGLVADYAGALAVSPDSGIQDLHGWMALVRKNPQAGNTGVAAPGSKPQFLLAAMARERKLPLNAVPYRGSVPMVQDLAGGHLTAGITALGDFLEFHRANKLKVIATTGERREPVLPDVPTAREAGYGELRMNFWIGMFAPAKTPDATLAALNAALTQALASPAVRQRMETLVFSPAARTEPQALAARVREESRQWQALIEASGWERQ